MGDGSGASKYQRTSNFRSVWSCCLKRMKMGNLKLRICTQGSKHENRKAEEEYFVVFLF